MGRVRTTEGTPGCCVVLGRDDSGSGDREKGRALGRA